MKGWKCNANDNRWKIRMESLEREENVFLIINESSTWMVASFITNKKSFPNLSNSKLFKRELSERFLGRGNLGNWFADSETQRGLYSLDLHHCRTIVLRNELEMVPRRFTLALEFRDVRCQLVEIDFRGSRYRANLKTEPHRRYRESYSNLRNTKI